MEMRHHWCRCAGFGCADFGYTEAMVTQTQTWGITQPVTQSDYCFLGMMIRSIDTDDTDRTDRHRRGITDRMVLFVLFLSHLSFFLLLSMSVCLEKSVHILTPHVDG